MSDFILLSSQRGRFQRMLEYCQVHTSQVQATSSFTFNPSSSSSPPHLLLPLQLSTPITKTHTHLRKGLLHQLLLTPTHYNAPLQRTPAISTLIVLSLISIVVPWGLPRPTLKLAVKPLMIYATRKNPVTRVSVAVASTAGQCSKTRAYNRNLLT